MTISIPDNPADTNVAACELIVRLPETITGDTAARGFFEHLAAMLDRENAFTGLSWHDAKRAATAIWADVLGRDSDADFLRARAERARNGSDGICWNEPAKTARAFSIAAMVLGS
jgi:hypothetical protein